MQLELSTWPQVEKYLGNRKDIIVPVGSLEQHGPMGFLGTDSICPNLIAREVAHEEKALVTPVLPIGMSQHHLGFPGSISLAPSTMISMVKDVVRSLGVHGFTHIFFLNGHGGNIDPVKAGFSEIYADHSFMQKPCPLHLKIFNWYEGQRVEQLKNDLFGRAEGSHATPSEISLSFFAFPDHAGKAQMTPKKAPDNDFRDSFDFRKKFADGRMGSDSSLASAEAGARFFKASVMDVSESYRAFASL